MTDHNAAPTISHVPFGTLPTGEALTLFTLRSGAGVEVKITNYGGIITELRTPDRHGHADDVVLGYSTLDGYLASTPYFGAIVGRVANRIAKGRFELDGHTYSLALNNGPNALHGGLRGFDKRAWQWFTSLTDSTVSLLLAYVSPDGEEGFPGTLKANVTYTLDKTNRLIVGYHATTDKATPVNLTQHTYWNLLGTGASTPPKADLPSVGGHVLTLHASTFTPVDATLIPTGQLQDVAGTPFDFRTPTAIGARIDGASEQLAFGGGYDHNWVIDRGPAKGLVHAARLAEPTTGRVVDVSTTEPGIQCYSGNFLDGSISGKEGRRYPRRSAVALETQHFPDTPNHPNFPSIVVRPGEPYESRTVFAFSTEK